MTSRTPPPQQYPNLGRTPTERIAVNSSTLDNNASSANKAANDQSQPAGNNGNTTIENRPVNKIYRRIPAENYSALFDIEYIDVPYRKEKEKPQEKDTFVPSGILDKQNTRGINTEDKKNSSNLKSENDNSDMAYEGRRVDQLEQKNKQHSAKIHLLENELRRVKLENDMIKEHFTEHDGPHSNNGYSNQEPFYDRGAARYEDRPEPRYPDTYGNPQGQAPPGPPPGRPQYKNEQHRLGYRDEDTYWGFNKIYDPQFLTAYRREHIPYYAKMAEKEKQEQVAGGLYIIRFADSGYDDVLVALRQLQPILKSNRGHFLGIARKQHVYPLEGDPEWWLSKDQHYRHPKIRVPYKGVEEAIAVFWFPYREKAKAFYDNSFHNRFRDQNFPTTRSYEGHYIPLLTPPILRDLNTYLVIELLNGKRYHPEDIQNFQARTSDSILKHVNNCIPFVASALEGRDSFKPGPLFDNRSKVFISRFDSMVDVSELWLTETVQKELLRNGLSGPRNVWAFSLMDWED